MAGAVGVVPRTDTLACALGAGHGTVGPTAGHAASGLEAAGHGLADAGQPGSSALATSGVAQSDTCSVSAVTGHEALRMVPHRTCDLGAETLDGATTTRNSAADGSADPLEGTAEHVLAVCPAVGAPPEATHASALTVASPAGPLLEAHAAEALASLVVAVRDAADLVADRAKLGRSGVLLGVAPLEVAKLLEEPTLLAVGLLGAERHAKFLLVLALLATDASQPVVLTLAAHQLGDSAGR
mmetsp:Transcript_11666/g.24859  ORF Transcript_11666/g.24859 Transcript_11666/m.24859 type:complete len:241 (+) Transcript_11666:587-1309(+)